MGQIKMGSRKLQECPGHRRKMAQLEPDRLPEEKQTNKQTKDWKGIWNSRDVFGDLKTVVTKGPQAPMAFLRAQA